ncbi:MAG: lactate racemase domain-containing protein [Gammaproteobacteria bacterium]
MFRVRQHFDRPLVEDIPAEVHAQLTQLSLAHRIKPGQTVAVTCGSRGIANIHVIIKAVIDHLKGLNAQPFVVPAMGSHGGGIAEGQRKIIESYGVTEQFIGCPIKASMDTVIVCDTAEGFPVHFDRHAHEADHVVVVGRVKPHTGFSGDIQSGLMKMMLIGLGKHAGAKIYHRAILDHSFPQILRSVAGHVLEKCGIVAGVAIVENGYDETAKIAGVAPEEFEAREKELLVQATQWMPKLPFEQVDLLIIDEFGKNISGSGMDSNVVGRKQFEHCAAEHEYPKIKRIMIRSLTRETHGNASGIGSTEFCSKRVLEEIDINATRINCLTGGVPSGAMLPLSFDTEREIVDAALATIGLAEPPDARVLWIKNTLHVSEVECSARYLEEARARDDIELLRDPRDLQFDANGDLVGFQPGLAAHAA